MPIELNPPRTALLVLDLQNDIIHENGKGTSTGVAAMVRESGLVIQVNALLAACRRAGLPVIHVMVQFRPGHPEIGRTTRLFGGIRKAGSLVEGHPRRRHSRGDPTAAR